MKLETPRLRVRDFRIGDAPALYPILSDPEVMRYLEPPYTAEQTRAFIETAGLCDPPLVYAAEWKATGTLVGHVIFHAYEADDCFELGWALSRDFWGRGVASELTEALLHEARRLGIREAVLECDPEQTATRRIAEKLGFAFAGDDDGLLVFRKNLTEAEDGNSTL